MLPYSDNNNNDNNNNNNNNNHQNELIGEIHLKNVNFSLIHYENMTLKIGRTKDMNNAENFQWDYKGLTFLNNNSRQISV